MKSSLTNPNKSDIIRVYKRGEKKKRGSQKIHKKFKKDLLTNSTECGIIKVQKKIKTN